MDSACPEKDVTEILRDSDHSTKVAPTTLIEPFESRASKGYKVTKPLVCGALVISSSFSSEEIRLFIGCCKTHRFLSDVHCKMSPDQPSVCDIFTLSSNQEVTLAEDLRV